MCTCGEITGRRTRRGALCKIPLRGGKCMTHDANLSKRNSAVARSFQRNSPVAFRRQRSQAGKLGFKATGGKHGWYKVNEAAAQWRRENPSGPEREMIRVLDLLGFGEWEREYMLPDGHSIDFARPDKKVGIEVNGHQSKPSFGEDVARIDKQHEKIKALVEDGWKIIVVDHADEGPMPNDRMQELKKELEKCLS